LSGPTLIGAAWGPTVPSGWELVGTADFNGDGKPDYVLFNATIRQTAIWYLDNNVLTGGDFGPTLPNGWNLVGVADFNGDGKADYLLYNPSTRQTVIWYLNRFVLIGRAYGADEAAAFVILILSRFPRLRRFIILTDRRRACKLCITGRTITLSPGTFTWLRLLAYSLL
jgi:FG-GAP-like repeat